MNDQDDFSRLGEELYEDTGVIMPGSLMPNAPTSTIYPKAPTTVPMPKPIVSSRDEITRLRTNAYDKYVDVMHKTLQGFSKLTNCHRTKEVNDGVAKIKDLISEINMYDERLKRMTGGKKRKTMKGKRKYAIIQRSKKNKHIRKRNTRKIRN